MNMLERIRMAGKAKGYDLARIATEAGIERAQIYQIAESKRGTSKHLPTIARVLDVSVSWLIAGDGSEPAQRNTDNAIAELAAKLARIQSELNDLRAGTSSAPAPSPPSASDEIDRIMNPDEHPRPQAPTHPRPAAIPGGAPRGR